MFSELVTVGYMVVINVGGAEERVDLSIFQSLLSDLTVVTAAPNSRFDIGQVKRL